jgi:hypothetical protein
MAVTVQIVAFWVVTPAGLHSVTQPTGPQSESDCNHASNCESYTYEHLREMTTVNSMKSVGKEPLDRPSRKWEDDI